MVYSLFVIFTPVVYTIAATQVYTCTTKKSSRADAYSCVWFILPLCNAAIRCRSAFEEECQCRKRDIQFLQVSCVPIHQPAQPTTVLMVPLLPTNNYLHTPHLHTYVKPPSNIPPAALVYPITMATIG